MKKGSRKRKVNNRLDTSLRDGQPSVTLFCDGASRGNPGPGAYGFVLFKGASVLVEEGGKLGNTTNNVAEYQGLIRGLRRALDLGVTDITVKCDSELMVHQLNGIYKVRASHLKPLFDEAKRIIKGYRNIVVQHVRREENQHADKLANRALDSIK